MSNFASHPTVTLCIAIYFISGYECVVATFILIYIVVYLCNIHILNMHITLAYHRVYQFVFSGF